MFKVVTERRAWWPVKWNGVTEEGRVVENEIELRFTLHGEDEHATIVAEAGALAGRATTEAHELLKEQGIDPTDPAEATKLEAAQIKVMSRLYADFVTRIASDWRRIAHENGEAMKWDVENLRVVMNLPGVFKATLGAYLKCRVGEKDIRAGN